MAAAGRRLGPGLGVRCFLNHPLRGPELRAPRPGDRPAGNIRWRHHCRRGAGGAGAPCLRLPPGPALRTARRIGGCRHRLGRSALLV